MSEAVPERPIPFLKVESAARNLADQRILLVQNLSDLGIPEASFTTSMREQTELELAFNVGKISIRLVVGVRGLPLRVSFQRKSHYAAIESSELRMCDAPTFPSERPTPHASITRPKCHGRSAPNRDSQGQACSRIMPTYTRSGAGSGSGGSVYADGLPHVVRRITRDEHNVHATLVDRAAANPTPESAAYRLECSRLGIVVRVILEKSVGSVNGFRAVVPVRPTDIDEQYRKLLAQCCGKCSSCQGSCSGLPGHNGTTG
ncbi:MAG TPA: hypothetical protein VJV79_37690, partial [Polyangiaceae bacterium]|nr:hypothetical protein [Polyangiaceae bacterium]